MDAFFSNAAEVLERTADVPVAVEDSVALTQVWNETKLKEVLRFVEEKNLSRICLQFPDDLLKFSVGICGELQREAPTREFFILADTTYCPCCVDEVGAEHISATGLVHFGPACLTKPHTEQLTVIYLFTEDTFDVAAFKEQITNSFPDQSSRLGVFYSTAAVYQYAAIKEALREYPNAIAASLALDGQPNLMHWHTNGVTDFTNMSCVYIGRDDQTLFNLTVSVAAKQWLLFDTGTNVMRKATVAASGWLRKRMFYIEKCKDAQAIGIVHGTVSSKGHLDIAARIQTLAKAHDIRTVLISVGKLNPAKLANFMEIDCFVLIGCPQNNAYTSREFYKPLVSVFECELALNPVWREQLPATYSMDYREMLPDGNHYSGVDGVRVEGYDISLITGGVRGRGGVEKKEKEEENGTSTDLMRRGENAVAERTAGDALRERSWRGLEQNLGQDAVAEIEQGRSGIAIRYEENPVE